MSTLLFKTIRSQRFNVNRAVAIMKHDLLLDPIEKRKSHRVTESSHLNSYSFRGKVLTSDEEKRAAMDEIQNLVFGTIANLTPNFDPKLYSRTKFKLKKWADVDSKTSAEERELFGKITADAERNDYVFDPEALLKSLQSLGKIKRFNDKKRAIETFSKLHNEKLSAKVDSSSKLKTGVEHVIFKVPNTNAQKLTGDELESIINRYYTTQFPKYPVLLSVVHRDETAEHVHLTVHAQNQKTLEYDFVQHQYESVKDKITHTGTLPALYKDIKDSGLISAVGEALQANVYEFVNRQPEVLRKNITFKLKEYSDAKHKELERKIIKQDTSKRIADREYNTANYLAQKKHALENQLIQVEREMFMAEEHNEELEQHQVMADAALDVKLRKLEGVEQDLSKFQESVTHNGKIIEQQEKQLSSLETSIKNARKALKDLMINATNYAHSVKEETLRNIKANFKALQKVPGTFAQEGHHQAREMQPTGQQKQDIDKAYAERFKP